MAARLGTEPATQPELMAIAREIPADKIDLLATSYLDIDDTTLSHIKYGEGYNSIQTNFKCLLHWCRNTTASDARQVLQTKLREAAKEGLVSQKGVDVLAKHDGATGESKGKNWLQNVVKVVPFLVSCI